MHARHGWVVAAGALLLLVGCGPPKQVGESNTPSTNGDYDEPVDVSDDEHESNVADPDTIEFDEEAAQMVMKRGAKKAAECPKVAEDAPTGEGEVQVIFDGPGGKIVDVVLGPVFESGSEMGQNCIKRSFIGEIIPPFKGQKTVPFTLTVPEKSEKK